MLETESTFGEWLRRQRRRLDLTQAELAQRADCSVMTIRKLERAELRPSKQLAELLAYALHIAPVDLANVVAFARGVSTHLQLAVTTPAAEVSHPAQFISSHLRPHNLEAQTTPLIGRDLELRELERLLENHASRLVTVLGAGGMGKTHLVQEFARQYLDRTQEQVFFVALTAVPAAEGLATAILVAIGYPLQQDGRSPEQQLFDYVQSIGMLLVLDNFEHLLAGVGLINAILRVAPSVKILVTSRERLLLSGEILYRLESLTFPGSATTTNLLTYSAVRLFLQRARHIRPTFEASADDLATIGRICRLVEGMPLGILLAAAWMDLLPLPAIADEISQSINFLESDLRDLPVRHRSIWAVFDYSWQQLPEVERTVFMQLAVFRGGFTRQAAYSVAGASLQMLYKLINQSLLQVDPQERYSLHELLRQYAETKLTAAQQREEAGSHHCAYYLGLLAQFTSDVKGSGQAAVLDAIEVDYENIRAAWQWAVAHNNATLIAQALGSLGFFYEWRGRFHEGEWLFAQAVAAFGQSQESAEQSILPKLLNLQATFHEILGHQEQASQCLRQALEHNNKFGRTDQVAQQERAAILHGLGLVSYGAGDRLPSGRLFAESLALYRTHNDRWGEAKVLLSLEGIDRNLPELANPYQHQQATERSKALVLESLTIFRQSGDQANLSMALETLATVFLTRGQAQEASEAISECLAIQHRLNIMNSTFIDALIDLGIAQEYLGLYEQMHAQAQQALALAQAVGDVKGTHRACFLLSSAMLVQQRFDEVEPCFQGVTHLIRKEQSKSVLTVQQLVNCGLASYRLGDRRRAQGQLIKALLMGLAIRSVRGSVHGLLLGALLLVEQGKLERVVELHALAMCYPFVANSHWCEDVAGGELAAVAVSLPAEVVTAARVRGQASDLWTTVAALLVELEPHC